MEKEEKNNYGWKYFEDIYNNTMKKGITFSDEMGKHIKDELDRLVKEREEWLKNKRNEPTDNG